MRKAQLRDFLIGLVAVVLITLCALYFFAPEALHDWMHRLMLVN